MVGRPDYFTPREENDIDLVFEIRSAMLQHGLYDQVVNFFDNEPIIIEASLRCPEVQRHLLNRYWNLMLTLNNEVQDSIDERFCLVTEGPISDWLEFFKTKVLNYIVNNKLPNRKF